jgi:hypothetical protein
MPNTPCLVGRGVSVACRTADVPADRFARVMELLRAVGSVHEADESLLDAVTGLSGSGPGFVAVLVEALADGGVRAGLPRPLALALAIETLAGTAALLEQTGEHPAQIKDRVASPGGTTIAGLAVLEQRGVRGAVGDAVVAAAARARELGQPAASCRGSSPAIAPMPTSWRGPASLLQPWPWVLSPSIFRLPRRTLIWMPWRPSCSQSSCCQLSWLRAWLRGPHWPHRRYGPSRRHTGWNCPRERSTSDLLPARKPVRPANG